jgi:hypothetical protein
MIWRGYRFNKLGRTVCYQKELTEEQFNDLWEKFKEWEGSQKEFYFKYVNRRRKTEVIKKNE